MRKRRKCKVSGEFVQPCSHLETLFEPGQFRGRPRGISFVNNLINVKTGKRTRTFVVIASGDYRKNGIIVNYCPLCGEHISPHIQVGGRG